MSNSESQSNCGSSHGYAYLVTLHFAHDDVPLHLSDDMDEAFEIAEHPVWQHSGVPLEGVLELPEITTEPVSTSVTTFRDGVPCGRVIVRVYGDDDDDNDDTPVNEPEPEPVRYA